MPDRVTLPKIFDAHVHFRGPGLTGHTVWETARYCSRAVVMPNVPAVEDAACAADYRDVILRAVPNDWPFRPLMTIKLTPRTSQEMIRAAADSGLVVAAKVYPEGATTGSHGGIRDFKALAPVLDAMQQCGMVLCVHCEDPDAFVLYREAAYLPNVAWALEQFPKLRIIVEHVTSEMGVSFVRSGPDRLAATVTAHHLDLTLDDVLGQGIRPHHFCYPVAKGPADRACLLRAARGHYGPRFFLGSDSAPHRKQDKESACGCAGIYSAPVLPEVLARTFLPERLEELDVNRFIDFTSRNGEQFYGLAPTLGQITLTRSPWQVPEISLSGVVPYKAGERLEWQLTHSTGVGTWRAS